MILNYVIKYGFCQKTTLLNLKKVSNLLIEIPYIMHVM